MEGVFAVEHDFTLPLGFINAEGTALKTGKMRLATAGDEILPMRDPRVQANPSYLTIILLSRVITNLGGTQHITPAMIEGLYVADLNYLQALYDRINTDGNAQLRVECPKCGHSHQVEATPPGE